MRKGKSCTTCKGKGYVLLDDVVVEGRLTLVPCSCRWATRAQHDSAHCHTGDLGYNCPECMGPSCYLCGKSFPHDADERLHGGCGPEERCHEACANRNWNGPLAKSNTPNG